MRKRELAAELACVLAMSAIRNSDQVGLILFSDRIERFVPPAKGRSHALRVVREILGCKPAGTRHRYRRRRCELAGSMLRKRVADVRDLRSRVGGHRTPALADLQRALRPVASAHDVVALHVRDPHERELPDVGLVTVEDAETGEVVELDTGRKQGARERSPSSPRARAEETARMLRARTSRRSRSTPRRRIRADVARLLRRARTEAAMTAAALRRGRR